MIKRSIGTSREIAELKRRLDRIEETLAEVASGNLLSRIPIDKDKADRLTAIEIGINLIVSDLEAETSHRLMLAELLAKSEDNS